MIQAIKESRMPLIIGVILLGIDSLTKYIANVALPVERAIETALPFWKWFLTYNEGYHYIFGEMAHFRLTQTLGLVAVLILIGIMIKNRTELPETDPNRRLFGVYISLLIGATGNPWETLFLGRVTDFFIFTPLPWPSNLADQYINIAIYIFLPIWLYISFKEWRAEKKAKLSGEESTPEDSSSEV
ncbi:MAG: hypothetical protein GF372_04700 [Candidatus Marinimicrobia bacterium]|nr:hypothetical protein [Candidatus Neomarinimicrobiota bacterium]